MTTSDYLSWFDDVVAPTGPMFRLVRPEIMGWKPTERSFTVGQLLAHIPGSLVFNARILTQPKDVPSLRQIFLSNRRHPTSTVDEAIGRLAEGTSLFHSEVGKINDRDFHLRIITTPQRGDIPVWRFCAFVLEHHIHHLMELHLALRILGLPVDTRTLYAGA
jgi:hypothetical protein